MGVVGELGMGELASVLIYVYYSQDSIDLFVLFIHYRLSKSHIYYLMYVVLYYALDKRPETEAPIRN